MENRIKTIEIVKARLDNIMRDKSRCKEFIESIKSALLPNELEHKLLRETQEQIGVFEFYEEELNHDLEVLVYSP